MRPITSLACIISRLSRAQDWRCVSDPMRTTCMGGARSLRPLLSKTDCNCWSCDCKPWAYLSIDSSTLDRSRAFVNTRPGSRNPQRKQPGFLRLFRELNLNIPQYKTCCGYSARVPILLYYCYFQMCRPGWRSEIPYEHIHSSSNWTDENGLYFLILVTSLDYYLPSTGPSIPRT